MSNQGSDGEYELEKDFVDEDDLEGRFKSCLKNTGHKQFLSLTSLQLKHLPERHRKISALDFMYHVAQLTVMLVVDFISPDRPCHCGQENTSQDGQCKCLRGNVRHVGSGLVTGLAGPGQLTPDVRDSTKTYFILVTAAHVIFDTREAQRTEIEFFYDDPHDRSSVRKALGLRVLNTNLEADFSEVLCVTEDHVISDNLNNSKFNRKIQPKLQQSKEDISRLVSEVDTSDLLSPIGSLTSVEQRFQMEIEKVSEDLVFHISHPHGTSKKVTFGNIVSADTRHGHYQLIYSLATCRGSSGGPVFVIPEDIYDINYTFKNVESIYSVPHARHHGNELNSSSSFTVYFSDYSERVYIREPYRRRSTLSDIVDVAFGYRYRLIKKIYEFTVAIHVLNDATLNSKNMASGFVTRLANNDDIRPDLEDTTQTYFIMVTGAHVFSDRSQAKETEINFFCDDLQDMSSARKAFGWRVLNSDKETNVSEVLCFTTDQVISSMLKEHFLELSPKNIQNVGSSMLKEHFFHPPMESSQSFVSEFTSKLKGCLTDSCVFRDYFITKFEERTHLLYQVYMSLNTAFEKLILITLFKDINNFASHILLRVCEDTYYSPGSLTFKSNVLDYVMVLHNFFENKEYWKTKYFTLYSTENHKALIEYIKNISNEVYHEMQREEDTFTFFISHQGTKKISFGKSYLIADLRAIYKVCEHNNSPVFTIRRDVRYIGKVESNAFGIALCLHESDQFIYEYLNQTLNRATISFPSCDTRQCRPIRFWEDQLKRMISDS